MSFTAGFEKRSYSYRYEIKELEKDYAADSKKKKSGYLKPMAITGGILGATGAVLGGITHGGTGAALGGLAGGALGAGIAGLGALSHNASREEGKRVMALSERKRRELLEHEAHTNEIASLKAHISTTAALNRPYYDSHRFDSGFHKRSAVSGAFKGTVKMLATEGERAASSTASHSVANAAKAVEKGERTINYGSFNPRRLFNYKPTPTSQRP